MRNSLVQDVVFDDHATLAMGLAFDSACESLVGSCRAGIVREIIAKRIVEAAKSGERDPMRLRLQAMMGFGIDHVSVSANGVGRNAPSPAYASVAHAA